MRWLITLLLVPLLTASGAPPAGSSGPPPAHRQFVA
jgi:hypothetical protein